MSSKRRNAGPLTGVRGSDLQSRQGGCAGASNCAWNVSDSPSIRNYKGGMTAHLRSRLRFARREGVRGSPARLSYDCLFGRQVFVGVIDADGDRVLAGLDRVGLELEGKLFGVE